MRGHAAADLGERDVVVHVAEPPAPLRRRLRTLCGLLARWALAVTLAALRLSAQHLHLIGAHLGAVTVVAVLVRPFARAESPGDENLAALLEILPADLGQLAECGNRHPLGAFLVLGLPTHGDAEVAHGITVGQVARFRVSAEAPDEIALVEVVAHGLSSMVAIGTG